MPHATRSWDDPRVHDEVFLKGDHRAVVSQSPDAPDLPNTQKQAGLVRNVTHNWKQVQATDDPPVCIEPKGTLHVLAQILADKTRKPCRDCAQPARRFHAPVELPRPGETHDCQQQLVGQGAAIAMVPAAARSSGRFQRPAPAAAIPAARSSG